MACSAASPVFIVFQRRQGETISITDTANCCLPLTAAAVILTACQIHRLNIEARWPNCHTQIIFEGTVNVDLYLPRFPFRIPISNEQ